MCFRSWWRTTCSSKHFVSTLNQRSPYLINNVVMSLYTTSYRPVFSSVIHGLVVEETILGVKFYCSLIGIPSFSEDETTCMRWKTAFSADICCIGISSKMARSLDPIVDLLLHTNVGLKCTPDVMCPYSMHTFALCERVYYCVMWCYLWVYLYIPHVCTCKYRSWTAVKIIEEKYLPPGYYSGSPLPSLVELQGMW